MKLLATQDVHQHPTKWEQLVRVSRGARYDVVAVSGDLFPHQSGILRQPAFLPALRRHAAAIGETGAALVLIPGNDDNGTLVPALEQGDRDGLWHHVADRAIALGGHEFAGMPWVPDYPFGYKYWCRRDGEAGDGLCPRQFAGAVTVGPDNNWVEIADLAGFLAGRPSIEAVLASLADKVQRMERSVWLIHSPPYGEGLDVIGDGTQAGSHAVLAFLGSAQPLLALHGHIHESHLKTGVWWKRFGRTVAVNPGQTGARLLYAEIELDGGEVRRVVHSEYGSWRV